MGVERWSLVQENVMPKGQQRGKEPKKPKKDRSVPVPAGSTPGGMPKLPTKK